jgi:gliding motility-associated-like protein
MMKKVIVSFLFSTITTLLFGQVGAWTWMRGSQTPFLPGIFGTQTVSSPTNEPPSGYQFAEWTDNNGNFWVIGGLESNFATIHSALWRYTPANNEWTWMKGPSTQNAAGVYGVQGVPSPLNYPGARTYGARTWTDNNGFLWLYGGYGFDATGQQNSLQDLWRYNIATNEWTWMNGPQTGGLLANFGIQGVPSPTNIPPPCTESTVTWVDAAGNLWMYGGVDFATPGTDDMWKYDIAANVWIWVSGQSSGQIAANYGTLGVPSPTNTPGGRYVYSHWQDQQGNFWMYGGFDLSANFLSDMWRYNPNTGIWTWMAGSNLSISPLNNTFTAQCTPGGYPDGTYENRACWTDQCGRFWGMGTEYNYLWFFDPNTLQFTWVTGSLTFQPAPVYGTQNVPSTSNAPPPVYGANGFVDNNGNLWLFGGYNSLVGELNLLWRYELDSVCGQQNFDINFPITVPSSACIGAPVAFSPQSQANYSYFWDFGDTTTTSDTSSLMNPNWVYTQPGTYNYTVIVVGNFTCGRGEDTATGTITIYPQPVVNLGNDTTLCSGIVNLLLDAGNAGANYSWSTGSTSQFINVSSSGTYSVTVTTDPQGNCTASDTITIINLLQISLGNDTSFCAGDSVILDPGISQLQYLWNTGDTTQTITTTTGGIYTLQITNQNCQLNDTINLTVNALPVVNIGNDTLICGTAVNLLLDAGNSGNTYLWNTGDTLQTITATQAGSYSVTVNNNQCSTSDTINITLQTLPQPDLGGDTAICAGQSLLLNPGITGTQYIWSNGATTPTITVSTPGLYSVQIINPPCTVSTAMNLSITPLPVVNLGADTTLCPNNSIVLNAQNPGATYLWSNSATTQTITTSAAGNYAVTVTAQNCSASDTISISTTQNLELDEAVSLCGSFTPLVLDAGNTGATYLWSTGDNTQTISIEQPGTYWVNVSAQPCVLTDTIEVTGNLGEATVYIPNSFTPNGDGLNDRFTGYGENFTSFRLMVFNRWGELIFETTDPNGWDGFYAGQRAKGDVYVYKLTYTSSCTGGKFVDRLGHVTLIR